MIRRGEVSDMQALSISLQGVLGMAALTLLALINVQAFGVNLTALFLPLAAVYLWPFRAHYGWSLFGVWLCGLLQDILTGGPIGLFGLIYVLVFMVSNPTARQFAPNLIRHWILFSLLLLPTLCLSWVLSAPSTGQFTSFWRILIEGFATLALFPIVYGARQIIRHMTTDDSDAGLYL